MLKSSNMYLPAHFSSSKSVLPSYWGIRSPAIWQENERNYVMIRGMLAPAFGLRSKRPLIFFRWTLVTFDLVPQYPLMMYTPSNHSLLALTNSLPLPQRIPPHSWMNKKMDNHWDAGKLGQFYMYLPEHFSSSKFVFDNWMKEIIK